MRGKEKASLNDWVQFLMGNIHKNETRILACITVLISLVALFFIVWSFHLNLLSIYEQILKDETIAESIKKSYLDLNQTLMEVRSFIILAIVFFIVIPLSFSTAPDYNTSKKLLDKILLSDGFVSISYIREQWIDRKKIKSWEKIKSWFKEKSKKERD